MPTLAARAGLLVIAAAAGLAGQDGARDDATAWMPPGTAGAWRAIRTRVARRFQPTVSVPELAAALGTASAPLLVDVRSAAEFAVSHLRGALHGGGDIDPVALLADRPRSAPIVTYCSVGWRSAAVAEGLRAAGFTSVANLQGSLFEWADRGLPMVDAHGPTRMVHGYDRLWAPLVHPILRRDEAADAGSRVLVGDGRSLLLLERRVPWDRPAAVAWRWTTADSDLLRELTNGRPLAGGDRVLVTAAGGGIAVVDVATGRVVASVDAGEPVADAVDLGEGGLLAAASDRVRWLTRDGAERDAVAVDRPRSLAVDGGSLWVLAAAEVRRLGLAGGSLAGAGGFALPADAAADLDRGPCSLQARSGGVALACPGRAWRLDPASGQWSATAAEPMPLAAIDVPGFSASRVISARSWDAP